LSLGCSEEETPVEIEVRFCDFDNNTRSMLEAKRLLSKSGELAIFKSCLVGRKKPDFKLIVCDFTDERFQNLRSKKEKELNAIGDECGLAFTKSGRSITNESKIQKLVEYAKKQSVPENDVTITPDDDTYREIEELLPDFALFPSYMTLGTDQAQFQNPFSDMIVDQIQIDRQLTDIVQEKVKIAISKAVKEIEDNLLQQTEAITKLIPNPEFSWRKLVNLNLETEDQFGKIVPLANRGLGVQRLAMVAFLKYLADHGGNGKKGVIFGIEEPETFLHPSAQRDLINAFRQLKEKNYQIIMTSHSPVFAAEASKDDLILVSRQSGEASIVQGQQLSADLIVEELGILPRDQIAGFSACVFVEGPSDETYLETATKTLKASGRLPADFAEVNIGIVLAAGDNLRFYVEKGLLKKLNRKFAVVIDSDKKSPTDSLSEKLLRWKTICESDGGVFVILRKRTMENYLHPEAIRRVLGRNVSVEDFNDVKSQISNQYDWRHHLKPVVKAMTAGEILEMDKFSDQNGNEKHELVEILKKLLQLAE